MENQESRRLNESALSLLYKIEAFMKRVEKACEEGEITLEEAYEYLKKINGVIDVVVDRMDASEYAC